MCGLERRLREQDAVVRDDADQVSVEPRKSRHERRAIPRLELVEPRAIHNSRDDFAHIVRSSDVGIDDAIQVGGVIRRLFGRRDRLQGRAGVQRRHDRPAQLERVRIVLGKVVGNPGYLRMDVRSPKLLRGHFLACCRFDERWAAKKNRPGALDDDGFVGHRRHVRATGRAGSHHDGDLRNTFCRQPCLIEENPSEVLAVGKHIGLQREKGSARIDEINTRQPVLERDLLRAEMLLDRHRIVSASLDGRVVGHDHDVTAGDTANARHDSGAGRFVLIEP